MYYRTHGVGRDSTDVSGRLGGVAQWGICTEHRIKQRGVYSFIGGYRQGGRAFTLSSKDKTVQYPYSF